MLPILLALFSAITLAAVNTAIKAGVDILVGRALLSTSAAIMIAPAAFFVPLPDGPTWTALGWTLPAHALYQTALVKAMQRGDLSLVFPIMRGLAPLLTAAGAYAILGETLTPLALAGLVVATGAVVSFALPRRGAGFVNHPDRTAIFWAVMTALGVALYTITDARGVRVAPNPLTYIVWLFLLDWVWMTLLAILRRSGALVDTIRLRWRYGVFAGAVSILSFGAVLLALRMMEAARVTAMRETAVVFAALMGWLFLKEDFGLRRTIAAAIMASGLILLQIDRFT